MRYINLKLAILVCSFFSITFFFMNCSPMQSLNGGESKFSGFSHYEPKVFNNPFRCESGYFPEESPMKKLSKTEYLNTLYTLFQGTFSNSEMTEIYSMVSEEGKDKLYSIEYFTYKDIVSFLETSDRALEMVFSSDQRIKQAIGFDCASKSDANCIRSWIGDFGLRAYRRPLTSEEVSSYEMQLEGESELKDGARLVALQMLNTPHFLYKVEVEGTDMASDMFQISPFTLASRMSYLLTQSMPDDELLRDAENGTIFEDAILEGHIDRLMKTDGFKYSFREFVDMWLPYKKKDLKSYSDYTLEGINLTDEVQQAIVTETNLFLDYIVENGLSYKDLMLSRYANIPHAEVAKIYGVSSTGEVTLPENERRGLLSRVSMLADGRDSTSIIHRANHVYKDVLCTPLPDPPANAPTTLPVDTSKSQRQIVTDATSDVSCSGCHSIINPMGFALEEFDTLGRFRQEERKYNNSGDLIATFDVDATADLKLGQEVFSISSAVSMIETVAARPEASACFVKKWTEYLYTRKSSANDHCSMASMFDALNEEGGSVKKMVKRLVLSEHFKFKTVQQ